MGIVKNSMEPCTRNAFGEFWLALQKFVLVEVQVTVCLLCVNSGLAELLLLGLLSQHAGTEGDSSHTVSITCCGGVGVE